MFSNLDIDGIHSISSKIHLLLLFISTVSKEEDEIVKNDGVVVDSTSSYTLPAYIYLIYLVESHIFVILGIIHDFNLVAIYGNINNPLGVFGEEICVYSIIKYSLNINIYYF